MGSLSYLQGAIRLVCSSMLTFMCWRSVTFLSFALGPSVNQAEVNVHADVTANFAHNYTVTLSYTEAGDPGSSLSGILALRQ